MAKYIYEHKNWTNFLWQDKAINAVFGEVKLMQGKIIGQMNALGFSAKEEATLTTLTLEILNSSEREGKFIIETIGVIKLMLEFLFFILSAIAINKLGYSKASLKFILVVLLHYIVSYDRVIWLI